MSLEKTDAAPVVDLGAFIAELVVEAHKRRVSSRAESVEALLTRRPGDLQRVSSTPFTTEEDTKQNNKTEHILEVHRTIFVLKGLSLEF